MHIVLKWGVLHIYYVCLATLCGYILKLLYYE